MNQKLPPATVTKPTSDPSPVETSCSGGTTSTTRSNVVLADPLRSAPMHHPIPILPPQPKISSQMVKVEDFPTSISKTALPRAADRRPSKSSRRTIAIPVKVSNNQSTPPSRAKKAQKRTRKVDLPAAQQQWGKIHPYLLEDYPATGTVPAKKKPTKQNPPQLNNNNKKTKGKAATITNSSVHKTILQNTPSGPGANLPSDVSLENSHHQFAVPHDINPVPESGHLNSSILFNHLQRKITPRSNSHNTTNSSSPLVNGTVFLKDRQPNEGLNTDKEEFKTGHRDGELMEPTIVDVVDDDEEADSAEVIYEDEVVFLDEDDGEPMDREIYEEMNESGEIIITEDEGDVMDEEEEVVLNGQEMENYGEIKLKLFQI